MDFAETGIILLRKVFARFQVRENYVKEQLR